MFRRMLGCILAVGIAAVLVVSAAAAETGSIRVETTGGTVALYPVGDINGQAYRLYREYGGGTLETEDILSSNLAAWLYEEVRNGEIKASDLWGDVTFTDLAPGLYLVAQPSVPSGQTPFDPFLIALPWDGYVWEVNIDLELLPPTGESFGPYIWMIAMLASLVGLGICVHRGRKIAI